MLLGSHPMDKGSSVEETWSSSATENLTEVPMGVPVDHRTQESQTQGGMVSKDINDSS